MAICLRKSGRWQTTLSLNVGSGSVRISADSAVSAISAVWWDADFAECAETADLPEVMIEIPASLAFWKNVLTVMPVPWDFRHLSYWRSHSSGV